MYRRYEETQECIVFGCHNSKDQENFVGDICVPCYETIVTGKVNRTHTFMGEMQRKIDDLQRRIDNTQRKNMNDMLKRTESMMMTG